MIFICPKLVGFLMFYDGSGSPPPMGKIVKTTALKVQLGKGSSGGGRVERKQKQYKYA